MLGRLSRNLKAAFSRQVALAIIVLAVATTAASLVAIQQAGERALREEAAWFWRARSADPAAALPNSRLMQGYLAASGIEVAALPPALRTLPPGWHRLPGSRALVLVEDGPAGRLYLQYQRDDLLDLAIWLALPPLLVALLILLVNAWTTYRMARRIVTPVDWLAREVARWDPREPDPRGLVPDRLPFSAGPEVRQLAGALLRMSDRTRAFVRRERDFTRDASHELRTPLTVIRVASDLLLEDPELPPRARRSLQRIAQARGDMEQVIEAFLILAREADVQPQREDFDVRDVVHEQVEQMRPLLSGKPIQMQVYESGSPRLHASARVLGVMVGNLLRNACTFTDSGRIDVHIDADRVVIHDTGIGMSEEVLQRIYDPFYRADPAGSGKGMGLAVVRRLGERFDWPVSIESVPGRGTTAMIRFGG